MINFFGVLNFSFSIFMSKVTIIIPTKNRFKFLEKNISYYIQNQFKGNILILDSSSSSESKKISKFIESCKKNTH